MTETYVIQRNSSNFQKINSIVNRRANKTYLNDHGYVLIEICGFEWRSTISFGVSPSSPYTSISLSKLIELDQNTSRGSKNTETPEIVGFYEERLKNLANKVAKLKIEREKLYEELDLLTKKFNNES